MNACLFPGLDRHNRSPRRQVRLSSATLRMVGRVMSLAALASCRDEGIVDARLPRAELAWFTSAIAAQIDRNGQLPGLRPGEDGASEISAARAGEIAAMTHRQFGYVSEPAWSRDAGYTVRAADLRPCGRIDFVEAAYADVPAEASPYFKSRVGPQWLVRYCANSIVTAVEYYVSAQGLSSALDSLGQFLINTPITAISSRAINRAVPARESSEDAAGEVFRRSRRQISALPVMRRVSGDVLPWVMSWSLKQGAALPGSSPASIAYPWGNPRQWTVRDAVTAAAETDTLIDGSTTPVRTYILRRHADAVTHADLRQIYGQ